VARVEDNVPRGVSRPYGRPDPRGRSRRLSGTLTALDLPPRPPRRGSPPPGRRTRGSD
jgi:hypothetical protein